MKILVEVQNLTVKFGDFIAVNDVSFSVGAGEIFGFLGANGAGKTTTIRVLCGLLRPTSGNVKIAGAGFEQGEAVLKAKVGYMSQKFTLYNDLTVEENMDFTAALRKLKKSDYLQKRKELLDLISFQYPLNSKVSELSGGVKQQVSLASSLLHDPDIVFLDEPTAGVTPAARARFWNLIRKVAANGKTVFVTTHYMDEAEQCDRIALMRTGELIALDTPSALKQQVFPNPMFEFEPKRDMKYEEMISVQKNPIFTFFEPYGMRFHASINNEAKWTELIKTYENDFTITQISPTLEDVFIQKVEGEKNSGVLNE